MLCCVPGIFCTTPSAWECCGEDPGAVGSRRDLQELQEGHPNPGIPQRFLLVRDLLGFVVRGEEGMGQLQSIPSLQGDQLCSCKGKLLLRGQ